MDDIKGKKYRSGSANFARWAEHFGGVAVSLPGGDQYEAMGQGVIDCTMAAAPELTNWSLFDVTKAITLNIPGGNFAGVGTNNFNIDVWKKLTDKERRSYLEGFGAVRCRVDVQVLRSGCKGPRKRRARKASKS